MSYVTESSHAAHPSKVCGVPKASISNRAPDMQSAHNYTRNTAFTLQGRINATCHDFSLQFSYQWNIRRFSIHVGESHGPIGSFVAMPQSVSTTHTDLIVPADYLDYGSYQFEFVVIQMEKTSGRIMSHDSEMTWVQIVPSELVPVIAGGSARAQGKVDKLE